MIKFKMPIGDWSGDGHGNCKYFIVSTEKELDDVRKAHFDIFEKTGIDIHSLCKEYGDCSIDNDADIDAILESGISLQTISGVDYKVGEGLYPSSEGMAKLWIHLLNIVDPELKLVLVESDIPMLSFYGLKDKKHIDYVGYGLF